MSTREGENIREWWTPAQVAERYQVSTDTVLRWIRTKRLPAMETVGSYRIHWNVLEAREAQAKAADLTTMVRNVRRNSNWRPSGVDHFARRQKA